jgi:putative two-component system response regulator
MTVLVVDDTKENIDILDGILKSTYKVKAASNGKKAIEIVDSKDKPDLVLLDIMMPDMDGYTVCRHIKSIDHANRIPVIFVTTKGEIEDEVQGFAAGAVDYITKPVSPPIVLARVKTHLDLRNAKQQVDQLLTKTLMGSVKVLTDILALVSPTAFSQSSRFRRYARDIAAHLHLDEIWQFELAATLSLIGYITIPDEILRKIDRGSRLTSQEQEIFDTYPQVGADMIENIPRLETVADMIKRQRDTADTPLKGHPREWTTAFLGGQLIRIIADLDRINSEEKSMKSALIKMRNRGGNYPNPLLIALWETQSDKPELIEKQVSLEELREGMILGADIKTKAGAKVLNRDTEVSPHLLKLLQRYIGRDIVNEPIVVKYLGS